MNRSRTPLTIVVGSGGVGKTTLAAAMGLEATRGGADALVMTFDPSLRLKDTLGVGEAARDAEVPVPVDGPGTLHASLLDARRTFDRLVDWSEAGLLPDAQTHHSQFADFGEDPVGTVKTLYDRFDIELAPELEEAMTRVLSVKRSDAKGAHAYDRDLPGHDLAELRRDFAAYQARFRVPSDGDQP